MIYTRNRSFPNSSFIGGGGTRGFWLLFTVVSVGRKRVGIRKTVGVTGGDARSHGRSGAAEEGARMGTEFGYT